MRHHLYTMITSVRFVLPVAVLGFAALLSGCDSTADSTTPEAQKEIQARKADIQKADEQSTELNKKAGGKNAATLKNIKGRGAGAAATPQ
jgi:hypothetical protein